MSRIYPYGYGIQSDMDAATSLGDDAGYTVFGKQRVNRHVPMCSYIFTSADILEHMESIFSPYLGQRDRAQL